MEKWDCWNGLGDNDRDKDGERQTDRQADDGLSVGLGGAGERII